jgi:hypothetical protein
LPPPSLAIRPILSKEGNSGLLVYTIHNEEQQGAVVGGNAGGPLTNDGLASSSSLPGRGEVEQGGGQRGPRGQARLSLALRPARGSWARTGSAEQDTSGGDTERTT